MKKMDRKGQVMNQLGGLAVGIAVLAITLTVAFLVISEGRSQAETIEGVTFSTDCENSSLCNGTAELQDALVDIPGWVPLIVIAVIGSILLGLVALFSRRSR